MKLQEASKKEVNRIAKGTAICAVLMVIGFFVLSLVGVGTFSYTIIIGAIGGSAIAVVNFAMMCLMVQKAAAMSDEKLRRTRVQASYNLRLMMMAAWLVLAYFLPFVNVIAAAIPLFFPNVVIYYLNATGKLMPPDVHTGKEPLTDEEEDKLETFEN